jgi:hypothetical protein
MELADVGMIECRDGTRFGLEPLAEAVIRDLESDRTIQAGVAGLVNLTHAARRDERQNLVRAESRADLEGRHRRRF